MKVWVAGLSAATLLGGALALGLAVQDGGGRLAPGLQLAGVAVGGLTPVQARAALAAQLPAPPRVRVVIGNRAWTVGAERLGWQADVPATVDAAVRATAGRSLWQRMQGWAGQGGAVLPLQTRVDVPTALNTLKSLASDLNGLPRNARVVFDKAARRYVVTPDAPGRRVGAAEAVNAYAAHPALTTLTVPVTEWRAPVTARMLRPQAERGNRLMRPLTVTLTGTGRSAALTPLQVANLYWVRAAGIEPDEQAIRTAFQRLTGEVDRPAQNARYAYRDGVRVRVPEQDGRVTADRQAALAAFRRAVLDPEATSVVFQSKVSRPTLKVAALPDPTAMELIATGTSTYFGSSRERRVNIANAAAKISGVVVPAGEDFSFLTALGSITPDNGFVGGLIISGGRTVDGLGGGVCQVSTTAFRALYQAGLPVVERNQHSYRVGYYEPQVGFEAAVYDPGLDLRLTNDTGAPLFVRAINDDAKSTLKVEVWGVKPPRQVTVSPATILSRTPHPAARYVVNPRLPAGTVRQVDWAQDGYKLYITRTIQDARGSRTDRVDTEYQPWQAVYETGPRG